MNDCAKFFIANLAIVISKFAIIISKFAITFLRLDILKYTCRENYSCTLFKSIAKKISITNG